MLEFRDLVGQARQESDSRKAAGLLASALRSWRGRCCQGVPASARARAVFTAIDQECLAVACEAADLALTCGMAADVVPYLRQAAAVDSLNEAVQARLVLALAATGNQAAALRTYESVRGRLADELGIDPGAELSDAFQEVLAQRAEPAGQRGPVVRPAQLPPDLPAFAGRRSELAHLLSLLPSDGTRASGLTTIALDGMPGAGKTTLAVHWAHQVADQFPDGQLYVNMRGFDPNGVAMEAAEALRGFLDALGVHPDRMPSGLAGQTGLYRSLLSDRRVLVLIDNARDADQVRPLLPGASGCHVVVTSRNRLTGLVVGEGAHPLTLSSLSSEDARETMVRRLGRDRVAAEAEAVEEIIALCGRLPLALAIVASRAAANPHFPLSAITAKLKQGKGTLEGFRDGAALDVRSVFSWSYRILSPAAARLFRLLSLHTGPDIGTVAVAALVGLPGRETQDLLDELTRTRFLTEHLPGRFVAHDLIRAYAMELREEFDPPEQQHEALSRLLDHYLRSPCPPPSGAPSAIS
ncbi:MAG: BTAD domain-containing putative transcriptional regulator [Kibdelosporangium sp.]